MKTTVEILHDCGDYRAGEIKTIDAKRAQRLTRTGYARIVEAAVTEAPETAAAARPLARGPKTEKRG